MTKSLFIKIVSCVSAVAILFFACSSSGGCFRGGFLPRTFEPMEFKQVSEAEFMRSFRPRLMVAHGAESVNGKNILDDTRYTPTFPSSDTPFDAYDDLWKLLQHEVDSGLFNPDLVRSKRLEPSNIVSEAVKSRVKSLVDNANNHDSGGTSRTLKSSYTFIAKRKLFYPDKADYEIDYLYCWYDYNYSGVGTSFEGVTLGDFYMQPHSICLMRFNSNGYSTTSYCSADEIPLYFGGVQGLPFCWYPSKKTYSLTNSDGTVETLDFSTAVSGDYDIRYTNFYSEQDINSISVHPFDTYYDRNYDYYSHMFGDVYTNIQCLLSNGTYTSNILHYIGNNHSPADWYITSGAFFPNNVTNLNDLNRSFSIDSDIKVNQAPTYNFYNSGDTISTGTQITTENVTNYNDYGVTYNQDSGEFELDLDVLTAKVEADITPKFDLSFKGVYENQPAIDGDFTVNDNNYIDITDKYITDIVDKFYPPASGWEPPSYPAIDTTPLFPATYPTVPTGTLPPSFGQGLGETLSNGWTLYDSLGLTAILVPIIIMLLLWRLTGK